MFPNDHGNLSDQDANSIADVLVFVFVGFPLGVVVGRIVLKRQHKADPDSNESWLTPMLL